MKRLTAALFIGLSLLLLMTPSDRSISASSRVANQFVEMISVANGAWVTAKSPFSVFSVQFSKKDHGNMEFIAAGTSERVSVLPDEDDFESNFSELLYLKHPVQQFKITGSGSFLVSLYHTEDLAFDTLSTLVAGPIEMNGGVRIIPRSVWGADESWRVDSRTEEQIVAASEGKTTDQDSDIAGAVSGKKLSDKEQKCVDSISQFPQEFKYSRVSNRDELGNRLLWPYQYSPVVKKIVIHHTAESSVAATKDGPSVMRAIYSYHARTRGWGDIGYNYIIDHAGNIYEGRAGGDFVSGAHTYCNNVGTIGISLMGNFQLSDPDSAQLKSLSRLAAALGKKYSIDVGGASFFHGKLTSNLLGHRDLGPTSCPGENLYQKLPQLRMQAALGGISDEFVPPPSQSNTSAKEYAATFLDKIAVISMAPSEKKTLLLRFRNNGSVTWGAGTWLYVPGNSSSILWADSILPDKNYVAANMTEESVPTGSIATFSVTINGGYQGGTASLEFTPIVNGKRRVNSASIVQPVRVSSAKVEYQFVDAQGPKNPLYYGQIANTWIRLKNTGNVTWRNGGDHPAVIVTADGLPSRFKKEGDKSILGFLESPTVAPGEIGKFIIDLDVPNDQPGAFKVRFRPIIADAVPMYDAGMNFTIIAKKPRYSAQAFISTPTDVKPGEKTSIDFTVKNTSDIPWKAEEVSIRVINSGSFGFAQREWSVYQEIPVGGSASITLPITAPMNGNTPAQLQLFADGQAFPMSSIEVNFKTAAATYTGELVDTSNQRVIMAQGERKTLQVRIKNTGNMTWTNIGPNGMELRSANAEGSKLFFPGMWPSKTVATRMTESSVPPGSLGTFTITIEPLDTGRFADRYELFLRRGQKIPGVSASFTVLVNRGDPKTVLQKRKAQQDALKAVPVSETSAPKTPSPAREEKVSQISDSSDVSLASTSYSASLHPIRVKISFPLREAKISATSDLSVLSEKGEIITSLKKGDSLSLAEALPDLTLNVRGITKLGGLFRVVPSKDGILTIVNWDRANGGKLNYNEFRGILEARLEDGKLILINELPLEEYLAGLAEAGQADPIEKKKALAVIARSYAMFYLDPANRKFPGKPYDGNDDPAIFQKYLGYGIERRSKEFVDAVKSTFGEVVTYDGKLIKTPFFSQSDGRTRSAEEVWGWKNTPYLVSVSDTFCGTTERKGHGVGLSGCGARELAKQGKTYQEIIKYYYRGVEMKKI